MASKPDFSSLTFKELQQRYYDATDDDAFSDLEEELIRRHGGSSEPVEGSDSSRYTHRTPEAFLKDLQTLPFYIASPEAIDPDGPTSLCAVCKHLDFRWMLANPVPLYELSLGMLKDIWTKEFCAFCRLVKAAVSLTMDTSVPPKHPDGRDIELGLRTWDVSYNGTQFNLELDLHPLAYTDYPTILLQPLCESGSLNYGRRICPLSVDLDIMKGFLDDCVDQATGHELQSIQSSLIQPHSPAHLIDVIELCIVESTESNQYFALSYVWGTTQPFQLTSQNLSQLKNPGILAPSNPDLPPTIRDAMELTRRLGGTFLWVDALCIVQDRSETKHAEIAAMDKIYGNAVLTLIASSAETVHHGLPGISSEFKKRRQHIEEVQGIQLTVKLLTIFDTANRSKWNTRAWTYQERLLSRRKLFITEVQWIFFCEHSGVGRTEDVHCRPQPPEESWGAWPKEGIEKWHLSYHARDAVVPQKAVNTALYLSIVEQVTSRQISFESDILNAFKGIANLLSTLFRDDFIFGIPASELDTQLLWQPRGLLNRRIDPESGRPIFPSWSWAGWEGIVMCKNASRENQPSIDVLTMSISSGKLEHVDMTTYRQADQQRWNRTQSRNEAYWREDNSEEAYFAHPLRPKGVTQQYSLRCVTVNRNECLQFYADVSRLEITGEDLDGSLTDVTTANEKTHGRRALVLRTPDKLQVGYVIVPASIAATLRPGIYDCVQISVTSTGASDLLERAELIPFSLSLDQTLVQPRKEVEFQQADILVVEWDANHEVAFRLGAGVCHVVAFQDDRTARQLINLG